MLKNIFVVGVGGQGVMTLVELIAGASLDAGIPVRAYTQSSLSQLAGQVTCHIRLGECHSAKIPQASADYVISLELAEAMRTISFVKPGSAALVSLQRIYPSAAKVRELHYPTEEEIATVFDKAGAQINFLPLDRVLGTDRIAVGANIAMLGAFIAYSKLLERTVAERAIEKRFSSAAKENLKTFAKGFELGLTLPAPSGYGEVAVVR